MAKSKQTQLNELKQQILDDKVCPELAAGATQLVFGEGNPDSDLVFIGEAPGKNEDLKGIPFIGAAGKFLNEMLETIGLKREDVYITNIVKYRPPSNRDPLPEEKSAFLPFLQKQLEIIKPKLIITLGRHSMECFLPGLKISQAHGQPQQIRIIGGQGVDGVQGDNENRATRTDGTESETRKLSTQQSATKLDKQSGFARVQGELTLVILPLFHPAAALYNGGLRKTLIDDFASIPAMLLTLQETK